ncbi:hypothetical protein [Bacteroides sp. 224]|uniref:hypothetical protein n=1 Tax=Bacteroides sp. 224 TaxID=2302936 RepID=UPI0013D2CC12|nr:hypothetical protein [Bacteroides sp. 224]NDV63966.1 hypothetical protein [Bacteroides sp. 224]
MCDNKARGVSRTLNQHIQNCSICGDSYDLEEFQKQLPLTQLMKQRNICFKCAFWLDKIENPNPNREIIDGQHCTFHPSQNERSYFQGCGGREFYILRNDKSLAMSNNVWFQGKIPDRFRESLPNTAQFISKRTYTKLKNNSFQCKAKGCWDRYHCLRYDISIEEGAGPWNIIPKTHNPGEENCESFINKNKL